MQEDFPTLDISVLKRAQAKFWLNGESVVIRSAGQTFIIVGLGREVIISWLDEDKPRLQRVGITYVELRFGGRAYFRCPVTLQPCLKLYLVSGAFVSREAYGLQSTSRYGSGAERWRNKIDRISDRLNGSNGLAKARGESRRALIEAARFLPLARIQTDIAIAIDRENERRRRAYRRTYRSNRRSSSLSTAEALRVGSVSPPAANAVSDMMQCGAEAASQPHAYQTANPDRPAAVVEKACPLDIRELARHWTRLEGGVWSASLQWPGITEPGLAGFVLLADFRRPDGPWLMVRSLFDDGRPSKDQFIRLVRSAPNTPLRWFMVCPISGTKCDILYLRDGVFASSKAQRLVYASQLRRSGRPHQ